MQCTSTSFVTDSSSFSSVLRASLVEDLQISAVRCLLHFLKRSSPGVGQSVLTVATFVWDFLLLPTSPLLLISRRIYQSNGHIIKIYKITLKVRIGRITWLPNIYRGWSYIFLDKLQLITKGLKINRQELLIQNFLNYFNFLKSLILEQPLSSKSLLLYTIFSTKK